MSYSVVSTDLSFGITMVLEHRRCSGCGRWWAIERGFSGLCPICSYEKIESIRADLARAERTINALKGAVTRARKVREAAGSDEP